MAKSISELAKDLRRASSQLALLQNPQVLIGRVNATIARERMLSNVVLKRFETEGASSGKSWAELETSTQRQRARQGFPSSTPILFRTGTLLKAAVGKEVGDQRGLRLVFKDGPAPAYIGNGKFRRPRTNGRLSEYAEALNKTRPFYGPLTQAEARPILLRQKQLLAMCLKQILTGKSINSVLRR